MKKNNKINKLSKLIVSLVVLFFSVKLYLEQQQNRVITQSDNEIRCIDGDTFEMNGNKIRLLGIDAPEDTKVKEKYGDEASTLTCNAINEAKEITLISDIGNEIDKYDRKLYWVYVDDLLLQELLVREGLAEIKYIDKKTVDMDILSILMIAEESAKSQQLKIWE